MLIFCSLYFIDIHQKMMNIEMCVFFYLTHNELSAIDMYVALTSYHLHNERETEKHRSHALSHLLSLYTQHYSPGYPLRSTMDIKECLT